MISVCGFENLGFLAYRLERASEPKGSRARMIVCKKEGRCYLRLRNSFVPSISVMYSKPASMSCVASLMFVAVLHVHWSVCSRNSACSMLMYIIVLLMFLCPKKYLTCMMSLVLWYSIVAFQCRKVWKDIFSILGFCSFWLAIFLCCVNIVLRLSVSV